MKNLQAADGGKGIAYAAYELCGIALALGGGKVGTQVGGRCGLREFRTSGSYYVKEGSTFRERQSQPEGETFTL